MAIGGNSGSKMVPVYPPLAWGGAPSSASGEALGESGIISGSIFTRRAAMKFVARAVDSSRQSQDGKQCWNECGYQLAAGGW